MFKTEADICSYNVTGISYFSKYKQDRICTYNMTLRRVHVTIVAMEKQEVLHILNVFL